MGIQEPERMDPNGRLQNKAAGRGGQVHTSRALRMPGRSHGAEQMYAIYMCRETGRLHGEMDTPSRIIGKNVCL